MPCTEPTTWPSFQEEIRHNAWPSITMSPQTVSAAGVWAWNMSSSESQGPISSSVVPVLYEQVPYPVPDSQPAYAVDTILIQGPPLSHNFERYMSTPSINIPAGWAHGNASSPCCRTARFKRGGTGMDLTSRVSLISRRG